jgi:hypothetical protein
MRILPLFLFVAACGSGAERTSGRDTLTQRQKDSLTAQSELPGARGVQGALSAQDSNAARQRVVDSIANTP